eukprot:1355209-Lingulodinium_polyedra.AAC.1
MRAATPSACRRCRAVQEHAPQNCPIGYAPGRRLRLQPRRSPFRPRHLRVQFPAHPRLGP